MQGQKHSKRWRRESSSLPLNFYTLKGSKDRIFKAPPPEWIKERVSTIQEVLERRVGKSALILRKLLGKIRLESGYSTEPDGGSNSLQWQTPVY